MKNILIKIIFIFLIGVTIFSIYRYAVKAKIHFFSTERAVAAEKLSLAQAKLLEDEKIIFKLKGGISLAEQANINLKRDNDGLKVTLDKVLKEKAELTARLSSLGELKKAIRKVKLDIHFKKVQDWLARREKKKGEDKQKLLEGNRGFFIKNGKLLGGARLKIEVVDPV